MVWQASGVKELQVGRDCSQCSAPCRQEQTSALGRSEAPENLSTIPRHAHWNAIHKKNEQCKLISAHVPVADSDDLGILALKTESWVAPCPPSDHLVWSMSAGRYRRDTNKVRPHLWIKRLRESSALGADEGDDTDLTEKKEGGEERGEEDWHKI